MKNLSLKCLAVSLPLLMSFFPSKGAVKDSEGMPIVYLRGTFGRENWQPDEAYRFDRTGTTYTLQIGAGNIVPEGKFKIGDEEWDFDFGGEADGVSIDGNSTLKLKKKGSNILTKGIYEGTISFEYSEENTSDETLDVKFEINSGGDVVDNPVSGTLPVMYINVYSDESHASFNDEVIDYNLPHKDYFSEAEYWIDLNGCEWMKEFGAESIGSREEPLALQIKARGNWTRIGFSKKPFKIKLDKKQNLLGLTPAKNKHYALLSHPDDDNGYLRNFVSFKLGEKIGLPWTPKMQPVELVVNGDYRGLYFLTESIRADEGRIEIAELDDNESDSEKVSGGYIVELDNYYEENQIQLYEKSWVDGEQLDLLRITWDTPEIYSELQKRFVTDQFEAINNAVGSNDDTLWSYLDLDDAVRYYLVEEIVSDTESYHGSTYLFRDRGEGEKWHFSPLWDAGNAFRGRTDDFFYHCDPFGNTWIPSIRENAAFNNKMKETWLWFMSSRFSEIWGDMEEFAAHISAGAIRDHARWKGVPHPDGGQSVADNSDMASKLRGVSDHIKAKVEWLKGPFGDFTGGVYPEPDRDSTPAAPLPDYAGAGIEELYPDNSDSPIEYYNLQGLRIPSPKRGEICIAKRGGKSWKICVR
ncbi:MAG: CotH kinase family protein [Muribaculaceae bacterium]|nr:CotH kinase family protein [Muribaculaceae bacterium]